MRRHFQMMATTLHTVTSENEDSFDKEDNNIELVRRSKPYIRFDP
jgi:hypothetical protein